MTMLQIEQVLTMMATTELASAAYYLFCSFFVECTVVAAGPLIPDLLDTANA